MESQVEGSWGLFEIIAKLQSSPAVKKVQVIDWSNREIFKLLDEIKKRLKRREILSKYDFGNQANHSKSENDYKEFHTW